MTTRAAQPLPRASAIPVPKTPPKPAPPKKRITQEDVPPRIPKAPPAPRADVPLPQHVFGFAPGWVHTSKTYKLQHIAQKHGARFYRVCIPGQGWHHWFVVYNTGQPLDPNIEIAIRADMAAKNLTLP